MRPLRPRLSPRAGLGALALGLAFLLAPGRAAATSVIAYVGVGTESPTNAIFAFRYDEATGTLDPLGQVATTPHAAFLAMHPSGRFLYAVNESNASDRANGHTVTAFAVEGAGPGLKLLDVVPCGGDRPCHIAVDATGKFAFVANYGSGTLAALPIRADGGLEAPEFVFQDPQPTSTLVRQQEPHAHCVVLDPTNQFLYSCDLGADRVMIYRFDAAAGVLARNTPAAVPVPTGFGPRHLAFGPGGHTVYVLNEIASKLIVFDRRLGDGALTMRQTLSTLPAGWTGENTGAEIQADASGRFVYASNRGQDSIAEFAVAPDGVVSLVGTTPCGKGPRFFALDPTGKFMLVAEQLGSAIRVFRVDPASGTLTPTATRVPVSMPVTIVFGNPL
jgi:6-phosphogluconolactonase